jgi:hypothetical protein
MGVTGKAPSRWTSLPSESAIFCFEGTVDDRAEGQWFPRLVEPRFFVQVREVENDRCFDAAEVGSIRTGARVDEKGISSVDEKDGTSGRSFNCCSTLSGSGHHRYGAHL